MLEQLAHSFAALANGIAGWAARIVAVAVVAFVPFYVDSEQHFAASFFVKYKKEMVHSRSKERIGQLTERPTRGDHRRNGCHQLRRALRQWVPWSPWGCTPQPRTVLRYH